jgi:hypothetical protein
MLDHRARARPMLRHPPDGRDAALCACEPTEQPNRSMSASARATRWETLQLIREGRRGSAVRARSINSNRLPRRPLTGTHS